MDFSDAQITKYAQEGEKILVQDSRCIQERVAIATTVGQQEYTLPDTCIGVTRVTWKGYKLEPYSGPEQRWSGTAPRNTIGTPLYYIFSDSGFRTIKILPAPPESLLTPSGDLWSADVIRNSLIVQYTSLPNFITTDVRIPSIIRRQILKDYILHRCFLRAGRAMDVNAGKYFGQKWEAGRKQNKEAWRLLFQAVVNVSGETRAFRYPARPVLPPQFGQVVE